MTTCLLSGQNLFDAIIVEFFFNFISMCMFSYLFNFYFYFLSL